MQKRQQINVQQEYTNEQFLEPEDLQDQQMAPVQQLQLKQDSAEGSNKNGSSSQHSKGSNNQDPQQPSIKVILPETKVPRSSQTSKKARNGQRLKEQSEQQQKIRKQLILQFKISELQKICTTLTSANQKLLDKIEELQEDNQKYKQRIVVLQRKNYQHEAKDNEFGQSLNDSRESVGGNQSGQESNYVKQNEDKEKDESQLLRDGDQQQKMLEEQVVDIEQMIKEYRQELKKAEQVNKTIKEQLSQKINQLQGYRDQLQGYNDQLSQKISELQGYLGQTQQQLLQIQKKLSQTEKINSQLQQQLIDSQQRNSSLQRQIQSLQKQIQIITNSTNAQGPSSNTQGPTPYQYYQDPTSNNQTQSRSTQHMTPIHRVNHHNSHGIRPSYFQQEYSQMSNYQQFDSSVQFQLEKLIRKLVNQLEHERHAKKRITDEMKRIQKDFLQNEKQIMLKNKKIYQLEMNLLKAQKNHLFNNTHTNPNHNHNSNINNNNMPFINPQIHPYQDSKNLLRNKHLILSPSRDQPNHRNQIFSPSREQTNHRNYNSPTSKQISPKIRDKQLLQQREGINTSAVNYSLANKKSSVSQAYTKNRQYNNLSRNPNISQSPSSAQIKQLQTFSLQQLLNEQTITLTVKQKLVISLKLVQFYQQKIYQYKNYNILMMDDVLVTNFNRIKLGLMKIRVEEHKKISQGNLRMRKNTKTQFADGPQKVIWNLGFLLNSLLLDVPTKQHDLGITSAQQSIFELLDNILDNKSLNKEAFDQLRECFDMALQLRAK